jgi:hypothetical protein
MCSTSDNTHFSVMMMYYQIPHGSLSSFGVTVGAGRHRRGIGVGRRIQKGSEMRESN